MKTVQTNLINSITERALAEAPASAADVVQLGEIVNHNVEAMKREINEQVDKVVALVDCLSCDILDAQDNAVEMRELFKKATLHLADLVDENFATVAVNMNKQEKRISDLEESVARLINDLPPKDPAPAQDVDLAKAFIDALSKSNIYSFAARKAA